MSQKYESYEIKDSYLEPFYDLNQTGQTFTPQQAHTITSIKLLLSKVGTPPTCYFDIKAVDANHKPTGSPLCSGSMAGADIVGTSWATAAWEEITLGDGAPLDADIEYFIVARCPDGDASNRANIVRTNTDKYPRGLFGVSGDGGSTWLLYEKVVNFQEWGEPPPVAPTVQTQDADNITHDQATLHGTLTDDGGEACEVRFQYGETTGYGTDTEWQSGKATEDAFEQLIAGLDSEKTYHFRAQAKNSKGTASGDDKELITQEAPPGPGVYRKVSITHPALKTVRVLKAGQEQTKYDNLSNLDEGFIHGELELPVEVPADVEVTTLANQVYKFNVN